MCSVATGQCPSSSISGWQFTSHYDCVNAGYGVAQKTFQNLKLLRILRASDSLIIIKKDLNLNLILKKEPHLTLF